MPGAVQVLQCSWPLRHGSTNNEAEYEALIRGLQVGLPFCCAVTLLDAVPHATAGKAAGGGGTRPVIAHCAAPTTPAWCVWQPRRTCVWQPRLMCLCNGCPQEAVGLGVKRLVAQGDSKLVCNQVRLHSTLCVAQAPGPPGTLPPARMQARSTAGMRALLWKWAPPGVLFRQRVRC